jgi:thiamine-monophosphate kinase
LSSRGNTPPSASGLRVSEAGERAIVERIRRRLPPAPASLLVGIGDDAAVAAPDRGALQVLTTDALVEGVHFDRRLSAPADIGFKSLAVNVSDVASMGGAARFALLSLMLPADTPVDDVDGLLDGLLEMAAAENIALAGGNLTRSPGPLIVDVTVVGSVKPRKVLTRAGGRAGDALYVTGSLGAAATGLEWLRANHAAPLPGDPELAACVTRYRRPEPRARIGALLGRNRAASACMDTSDGLADAITQICGASGTGATIDAALLPIHPAARQWFAASDAVRAALAGGDDYELLFAVPRRARGRIRGVIREARGVAVTRIGELTADGTIVVTRDGRTEPLPDGFVHF